MMITLYRVESSRTVRYYSISDRQGDLFSPFTFTASWGTALSKGQEKNFAFRTRQEMDEKLRELIGKRIRSGYRVLYTFFRANEYEGIRDVLARSSQVS